MTEREIFTDALLKPTPVERAAFLDQACGEDPDLRRRIEELIAEHDRLGNFLEVPPVRGLSQDVQTHLQVQGERIGTTIGPYKLLQICGEGGMGVVYMAEQSAPLLRRVALKIIKPGMDTHQVIARFEAERQALAMMDHPSIAKVLDAGTTTSGRPYFVMELVKGIPITQYCDQQHLTPRQRLELFIPICQAVQHAHQKGIIHRDLKPSNVLIALYDSLPVPKVIDFGVAKATNQRLTEKTMFTEVGSIVGTVEYMAPEQAALNNLDIDTRADIYSLGVLLYELLTGSPPFSARHLRSAALMEMLRIIREDEPAKPSTRISGSNELPSIAANRDLEPQRLTRLVKGDLDWIVMKCLEKQRERRYESASGLASEIQRYLADEPVLAGPPSAVYRLLKFWRRNRRTVIVAAVLMCSLIAGIVGTSIGMMRAIVAEQKTNTALFNLTGEQARTKEALTAETKAKLIAAAAEKLALHQAADSACDAAHQLCERGSVSHGMIQYALALQLAQAAGQVDLEQAIRWNLGMWAKELHTLAFTIPGSEVGPMRAAFHPGGGILATVRLEEEAVVIRLWDAYVGRSLPGSLRLTTDVVTGLTWNPDGTALAIRTNDGQVFLWRPSDGAPYLKIVVDKAGPLPDGNMTADIAFHPDGSKLIASCRGADFQIFDTSTGRPTGITITHPKGRSSFYVDWSRDGKSVITNGGGYTHFWDSETGKLITEYATGSSGGPVAISADGQRFLAAGNKSVRVSERATGKTSGPEFKHLNTVYAARFSPNGKYVLTGDGDAEARLWEVGTNRLVGAPIWAGGITAQLGFRPDGKAVFTKAEGIVRVWNLAAGQRKWDTKTTGELGAITFSGDGEKIYVAAGAGINCYDSATGRVTPLNYKPTGYIHAVLPMVCRRKDDTLIVGSFGRKLDWYNATSQSLVRSQTNQPAWALAISPDSRILVATSPKQPDASSFSLIDAETGATLTEVPDSHKVRSICWSPDGSEFVTSNTYRQMTLRDGKTGRIKRTFAPNNTVFDYHPFGAIVLSNMGGYEVGLYETASGNRIGPALLHSAQPSSGTFSRDGNLAIIADSTGETRLWHLATGKRVGPPLRGVRPTTSPDGRGFVLEDGETLLFYDMPNLRGGTVSEVSKWVEEITGKSIKQIDSSRQVSKTLKPSND